MRSYRFPPGLAVVTAILLTLTGIAAWLAESGTALPLRLGIVALAMAWIKGFLVAEHFMELRHAPLYLRLFVQLWLALACGGLMLAFW
ncbi:MAG: hypothetical protein RL244_1516 [Pseudomonadota bacterium]|jgi:hypothetical protein